MSKNDILLQEFDNRYRSTRKSSGSIQDNEKNGWSTTACTERHTSALVLNITIRYRIILTHTIQVIYTYTILFVRLLQAKTFLDLKQLRKCIALDREERKLVSGKACQSKLFTRVCNRCITLKE